MLLRGARGLAWGWRGPWGGARSVQWRSDTAGDAGSSPTRSPPEPPPPGSCCMSGCARCVWVLHAEELLRRHGPAALEQHVPDESVRAFLRLELRLRAPRGAHAAPGCPEKPRPEGTTAKPTCDPEGAL